MSEGKLQNRNSTIACELHPKSQTLLEVHIFMSKKEQKQKM